MSDRRYCVITPARDEAEYARRTLDSVVAQTEPPTRWIIVDDGSTDETPHIVEEYAQEHSYLELLRREDRGERAVGPGVIETFYAGYETIDPDEFDYVVKMDLDLELPPTYFETIIDRMEADPRLGTFSGKPYFPTGQGTLAPEVCSDEISVGMIKLYRVDCFRQIGGFVRQVMWDGIDCHRARQLGWRAGCSDDPPTRFIHLRPMGSSQKSIFTGRARHGFGQYYMGTGLVFLLASAAYRMFHRPFVLGSFAMVFGYLRAWLARTPRYPDPQFRRFLRRFQWEAMLLGKRRATERADVRGAAHWQPSDRPAVAEAEKVDAVS